MIWLGDVVQSAVSGQRSDQSVDSSGRIMSDRSVRSDGPALIRSDRPDTRARYLESKCQVRQVALFGRGGLVLVSL